MIVPVQLCSPNFDLTKFDSTKFKFVDTETKTTTTKKESKTTNANQNEMEHVLTSEKTKFGCFLMQLCFALDKTMSSFDAPRRRFRSDFDKLWAFLIGNENGNICVFVTKHSVKKMYVFLVSTGLLLRMFVSRIESI